MKYPTEFSSHPQTYACGKGGEIYRGVYYPLHPLGLYPHLSKTDAFALTYKRSRIGELPWKNPDLGEAAHTGLKAQLGAYSKTSDNGYDILDIIYLYKRMGVWFFYSQTDMEKTALESI
jgi:hypothetical protein